MSVADPSPSFIACRHPQIDPSLTGGFVAVGNFDGMHRGHQAVLGAARDAAEAAGRPAVMLTFEPHPRDVFQPDAPVFRLTPPAVKARIAAAMGLSGIVTVPFDTSFAALPADAFIRDVLQDALAVRGVSVGWNFHFGARRGGSPALLEAAGAATGFSVAVLPPFTAEDGAAVSSSRIRGLLEDGDIPAAAGLLGYRWFFDGVVVHGDKRGRTIGYPTANVRLPSSVRLKLGIYAVWIEIDGERRPGVASWGRRPTFDNGTPVFETYVFDFSGDLYGKTVTVTPVAFLRPELKFDSVDALVRQMDQDSAESRALLATLAPITPLDRAISGG